MCIYIYIYVAGEEALRPDRAGISKGGLTITSTTCVPTFA